ncbi:hypothetical protein ACVBEQ_13780 [Nakamurella sp. GG22]
MQALKSAFCGNVLGATAAPDEPDAAAPEEAALDAALDSPPDAALDAADEALVAAAAVELVSLLGALPQAARARPATANPATTLRL